MKITVFGATGGVGRHVMREAIAAGHDVTAVVRDPGKLTHSVRHFTADLAFADPTTLEPAVAGADAVLSGLGPRSSAEAGIAALGTWAIVEAMRATHVRRIVVVSAAPIGTVPSPGRPKPPKHDPGDGFLMRHLLAPMAKTVLRMTFDDLARMEDVLRESCLDWTALRPPRLTDDSPSGSYRTALGRNVRRGIHVARADVARCMLRALDQPETIKQTIGIAY